MSVIKPPVRQASVVFGAKGGFSVTCPDRASAPFIANDSTALALLFDELAEPLEEPEAEDEPPSAPPTIESLEAAGVVRRGVPVPEVHPDDVRMPCTSDGDEYPFVWRGAQANHYEVQCPNHARKRMERRGSNWACAGGAPNKPCQVSVPNADLGRVIAATLVLGGE